jgi:hypothetical protein
MLHCMQDQVTEEAAVEIDPREELLENAQKKFSAGDFVAVGQWLDETIDEAKEETTVLKPVRGYLRLDRGAVVVAATSGLGFLLLAVLTLFH